MSDDVDWPNGWGGLTRAQETMFLRQLRRELAGDHPFQHMTIRAIGICDFTDDVVYAVEDWDAPFFVSHPCWQKPDTRPWLLRKLRPRPKPFPGVQPIRDLDELAHFFD